MDHQGGGGNRLPAGYQTGPWQQPGAPTGPQQALNRDPARGFPPGPARPPQDGGYPPQDGGYAPQDGYPQDSYPQDGYPQGNAYSPVSGYQQNDWLAPDGAPRQDGAQEPGRPGRGRGKRRLSRRVLLTGAACVVALAAAGLAGYHYYGGSHPGGIHPGTSLKLPTSDPTAGSPYFSAKLGKWQHIGTRKLDPTPLTVNELYPPAFTLDGSGQYLRAATSLGKDCTLAVFGDQLQTVLQSGKCTQVVRATYLSGNSKMMGTIGVVNLSTTNAAQQAGKATGADELIAPLSTSKGPAKNLLTGTGVVYAEVKGHYLIMMYAEFTNLKSPSTDAQKEQLVDFAKGMFAGSANIGLSSRMLTGKPAAAG